MAKLVINKQQEMTAIPEQDPKLRAANFSEVALGYTEEQAINEAQRCMSCPDKPCMEGCPVAVNIPDFVRAIADAEFGKAYAIVKETNSLPAICGRVCPQETQCQGVCKRGKKGDPVGIGRLERFVADWAFENPQQAASAEMTAAERTVRENGGSTYDMLADKKAAMIGSGPASLTCAGELAKHGVKVTIFEALHKAGGVLVYGIPEFRLPKDLVAREIGTIEDNGVTIECDAVVGRLYTIDELMNEMGFDAVFIGTGAGLPRYMGIPGEALNGVCVANELLTRVNLMRGYEFPKYRTPVFAGKHCVVVGGGNVAMDAARTAKRLGSDVTIVYRRSEDEMPARAEEIEHAKEEDIKFLTLTNPVRANGNDDGWIEQLDCMKMELGEPDESGRRRPVPVEGSQFGIPCDMLVIAIGSKTNPLIAQTTDGLESNERNLIVADVEHGATSLPGVFAGGDVTTGAATVIEAMGAGRKAAQGIIDYLSK